MMSTSVYAGEPYEGYIYQQGIGFTKEYPSVSNYEPQNVMTGIDLGINNLKAPRDIFATDDRLYILDSGNGRIVVLDKEEKLVQVLDQFSYKGDDYQLNDPNGIMVTSDKIYVADTENQCIVRMSMSGEIDLIYTKPESGLISQDEPFFPQKVVVDSVGNVYTNVKGVFEGIVEYDSTGEFTGFFGGDRINNIFEIADLIFWKKFLTEEQQSKMKKVVPIEYSNLAIDDKNFIYTVSQSVGNTNAIRKLNWKEKNLLESMEGIASQGYGDIRAGADPASFVDVCLDESEMLYGLDVATGRVFQYDQQGNLLSVFGRYGSQMGTFRGPVAIESFNNKIYVLDNQLNNVTSFQKTEFGQVVAKATKLYDDGLYEEATAIWRSIVEINPNFMLAYTGVGKGALLEGNYKEALRCFELAANQKEYSDTYKIYRTQLIKDNFALISVASILLIGIVFWLLALKKRKKLNFIHEYISTHPKVEKFVLPFRVMMHPIDGFEEIKFWGKGSMKWAYAIMVALFLGFSVEWLYTGFVFKTNSAETFQLIMVLMQTIGMLMICIISNYAICSLLDGKAKFKELIIGTTYALVPAVLGIFINTGLSQILVAEEAFIMQLISTITLTWSLILIIQCIMILHQYTLKKTIAMMFLTLLGVMSILFLLALCFILYNQVLTFITSIYHEILLRL